MESHLEISSNHILIKINEIARSGYTPWNVCISWHYKIERKTSTMNDMINTHTHTRTQKWTTKSKKIKKNFRSGVSFPHLLWWQNLQSTDWRTFYYPLLRLLRLRIQPLSYSMTRTNFFYKKRNAKTGTQYASPSKWLDEAAALAAVRFFISHSAGGSRSRMRCASKKKKNIVDAVSQRGYWHTNVWMYHDATEVAQWRFQRK